MAERLPVEHAIAALSGAGIAILHFVRYGMPGFRSPDRLLYQEVPLIAVLVFGGLPLLWGLVRDIGRREFRADLLAGLSIVTAILLHEYLAGALVVLMLAGDYGWGKNRCGCRRSWRHTRDWLRLTPRQQSQREWDACSFP